MYVIRPTDVIVVTRTAQSHWTKSRAHGRPIATTTDIWNIILDTALANPVQRNLWPLIATIGGSVVTQDTSVYKLGPEWKWHICASPIGGRRFVG